VSAASAGLQAARWSPTSLATTSHDARLSRRAAALRLSTLATLIATRWIFALTSLARSVVTGWRPDEERLP